MSDQDPHDDLWELLGKARQPKVSPFFARNVLREIREQETPRPAGFAWLLRWRRAALAGAFALLAVGAGLWMYPDQVAKDGFAAEASDNDESAPVAQIAASPDFEVIVDLDELLAYEENSLWLNSTDSNTY